MAVRLLKTLSARVIAAFVLIIALFAAVLVFAVSAMTTLGDETRAIGDTQLPLTLTLNQLAERQTDLRSYLLRNDVLSQSPAVIRGRLTRLRTARTKLIEEAQRILDTDDGASEAYRREVSKLRSSLESIRSTLANNIPLYTRFERTLAAQRPFASNGPNAPSQRAIDQLRDAEKQLLITLRELDRRQQRWAQRAAENLDANEARLRGFTLVFGLLGVGLGLVLVVVVIASLRPLRRLGLAARDIAGGDYRSRIDEKGPSEVSDLAREFNSMAQALEQREKDLVRSERLATVGKMAAVITHEVRNPLSSISLNTELLEEEIEKLADSDSADARKMCQAITGEVDRLTALTENYLRLTRMPKPNLIPGELRPLVESLIRFESESLARRGVSLELRGTAAPAVLMDSAQLHQALLNLLRNAIEATEDKDTASTAASDANAITVELAVDDVEQTTSIAITDSGPGIPADHIAQLFDLFFTTKEKGTGIGLALAHQIIRDHHGRLRVDSQVGVGATFTVVLPLHKPNN